MSQSNVERVIGRLVTDEGFRDRFAADPRVAIQGVMECGLELTRLEVEALASIDAGLLARIADAIDPRIQKADLCRGCPS
jgi:Ribosomally synthesized peptide prototyped by Frankia Franean1_4349.